MRVLFFVVYGLTLCLAQAVQAEVILFESATLGQTGVPASELLNQNVPGTNVNPAVFTGVRFELTELVQTTQVGGHFVGFIEGTFFGAIVQLEDENDFPDSFDFLSSDFLGSTLLTFPEQSAEVFGDLSISLTPGWYALVFGSGLFGAVGSGGTVQNGADVDNPSYIAGQPNSGVDWINSVQSGVNQRFVVRGQVVPEPLSFVLMATASLLFFLRRKNSLR